MPQPFPSIPSNLYTIMAQAYSKREIIMEEFEKQLREADDRSQSSMDLESLLASSE